MSDSWGADVPVSMPSAPTVASLVKMGGFAFGRYGLIPDITDEQRERIATPRYVPYSGRPS